MYWPKINEQIERICRMCEVCQFQQPSNEKEPMIPHNISDHPWQCIATDLFDVDGHTYLLTVDRYSKNPHIVHNLVVRLK